MEVHIDDATLAEAVASVVRAVDAAGGRALLVGGRVRDSVIGLPIKDVDIEVYGLAAEQLRELATRHFEVNLIGESFAVLKAKGLDLELSIPRRESRHGSGHRGFLIESDPFMEPREAAARRDFTLNALAFDPLSGELLDFYGGVADLEARVLRQVSDAFADDALRVLRGMQLAARLDAVMDPVTAALCRTLSLDELAAERVYEEWVKLILRGVRPSRGLDVLVATGWLGYFPELATLTGCEQDPEWHPEGDVLVHTGFVLDFFASERVGDEWEDLVVGFACLCHDLGKPPTTEFANGRWRSHGHDEAGVEPTKRFLSSMRAPNALAEEVTPLVKDHLTPAFLYQAGSGANAVRRLAARVGRIDRLVRVARADQGGRPPKVFDGFPAGQWLLEQAAALNVTDSKPQPMVMGRHLIEEFGLRPGPQFTPLLAACFEAQLDGRISTLEEGLALVRGLIDKPATV